MKFLRRRTCQRLLILAVLAALVLLFLQSRLPSDSTRPRVVAFVVDSSASMMDNERSLLQLFDDITHGQVVTTILRRWGPPDRLHLRTVDNAYDQVDRARYFKALREIEAYLRAHPDHRVVVNISLGSHAPEPDEKQLIGNLVDLGAIIVAAAGNEGSVQSNYPAALPDVICVGASDRGTREGYSNYGDLDIFAEGSYQTVQSRTLPWDTGIKTHARTVTLNGTSFAAPRVSGLIIKMLRLRPSLQTGQILEILQETADDVSGSDPGSVNRLNALAAVSDRYVVLREIQRILLTLLEFACIAVLVSIGLLIVVPLPEFLFRVLLPERWLAMKTRRIERITARERKPPRDIRYLINCLLPGFPRLFEQARRTLLDIGQPAVKHLIRAYPYKPHDEFGDFKTCVYDLIEEIGGPEAEAFFQSEQDWMEHGPADGQPLGN